jgi:hypothetical protein
MSYQALCAAQWEPDAEARATHTCCKPDGHIPPHLCHVCMQAWDEPGGKVWRALDEDRQGQMLTRKSI